MTHEERGEIGPGIYEHFRGDRYLVLGVGNDSNCPGRPVVAYLGAQTGEMWVRSVADFTAWVCTAYEESESGFSLTPCPLTQLPQRYCPKHGASHVQHRFERVGQSAPHPDSSL